MADLTGHKKRREARMKLENLNITRTHKGEVRGAGVCTLSGGCVQAQIVVGQSTLTGKFWCRKQKFGVHSAFKKNCPGVTASL